MWGYVGNVFMYILKSVYVHIYICAHLCVCVPARSCVSAHVYYNEFSFSFKVEL